MKKPILLGVEGEAKVLFIDEGKCGMAFEPENAKDLAEKINLFYANPVQRKEYAENGLKYVSEKFNRDTIADKFWTVITSIG